jgi:hypothetical protein
VATVVGQFLPGRARTPFPYHRPMRRWLLLLLVALLPLRGWTGEAMAAQMQAQHQAQPATAAAPHAAANDCGGHHDQAQAEAATGPQGAQAHGAICAACQACSTMALAFTRPRLPAAPYSAAPPVPMAETFASAEPASADKPPIS